MLAYGKFVLVTMDFEKNKARNWSQEEVATLVDSVLENKEVIQSKHKDADTNLKKNRIWDLITRRVNSVALENRTKDQVKKKWQDYSSVVKGKESIRRREYKRTGGGPQPKDLTEIEQKTVGIIGETAVEGKFRSIMNLLTGIGLLHVGLSS